MTKEGPATSGDSPNSEGVAGGGDTTGGGASANKREPADNGDAPDVGDATGGGQPEGSKPADASAAPSGERSPTPDAPVSDQPAGAAEADPAASEERASGDGEPTAAEEAEPERAPATGTEDAAATTGRRRLPRWAPVAGLVVLGAGLLGAGWVLGQQVGPDDDFLGDETAEEGDSAPTDEDGPDEPLEPAEIPEGYEAFTDEEAGIALAVPEDWNPRPTDDPEVRLLVTPNGRDSLLVRVTSLGAEVSEDTLAAMQESTTEVIEEQATDVHVGPEPLAVDGVPGHYYIYSFVDEDSGERTAHSRYFLFRGNEMIVFVFQALPEGRFGELAETFDQITETIRIQQR